MDDRAAAGSAPARPRRPSGRLDQIIERCVGDSLVVYDLKHQRVHILNETATLVWQLCDGRRSVDEIVERVAERYADPPAQIGQDVRELVSSFASEQLLSA